VFYKNGQKVEVDEDNLSGFYSILDKEKESGEKDVSLSEVWAVYCYLENLENVNSLFPFVIYIFSANIQE
jgi:hypothetical protein